MVESTFFYCSVLIYMELQIGHHLPVEEFERKFATYPAELPVLAAHEDSEIKDMRAYAIPHFQIRLKMGHGKGAHVNTFILHVASVFHQMLQ